MSKKGFKNVVSMLIYDNWCKYDKNFFFLTFPKKMGRSGDGKQSIKLGWPY